MAHPAFFPEQSFGILYNVSLKIGKIGKIVKVGTVYPFTQFFPSQNGDKSRGNEKLG